MTHEREYYDTQEAYELARVADALERIADAIEAPPRDAASRVRIETAAVATASTLQRIAARLDAGVVMLPDKGLRP